MYELGKRDVYVLAYSTNFKFLFVVTWCCTECVCVLRFCVFWCVCVFVYVTYTRAGVRTCLFLGCLLCVCGCLSKNGCTLCLNHRVSVF